MRLAALLIVALQQPLAYADTPPQPDQAETCTLAKQQPGEECLMCSAWNGDPAKCQKHLAKRGYERRCRGSGASVWSEVWCRAVGTGPQPTRGPQGKAP